MSITSDNRRGRRNPSYEEWVRKRYNHKRYDGYDDPEEEEVELDG